MVEVARASVGIGSRQGFNGGDGFFARAEINLRLVRGEFEVRSGRITLSNGTRRMSVAISARVEVNIRKHEFARHVPPFDINIGRLELRGGDFRVNGRDDALGVVGTVGRGFFSVSFFVDFNTGSVRRVNANAYQLNGAAAVRQQAALGAAGYYSGAVALTELVRLTGMESIAAPGAAAYAIATTVDRLPITVSQTGTAFFGIVYPVQSGMPKPSISVETPDGTIWHRDNTPPNSSNPADPATYLNGSSAIGDDQAIVIARAEPGTYYLTIANPPANYEQVSYMLNAPPTLTNVGFECESARFDSNFLVTTNCDNRPAGDGVRVSFRAADHDSPTANLYVCLVPLADATNQPDWARTRLMQEHIPLNNLGAFISTERVPTGRYRVLVGINDGDNQPVEELSELVVEVFDSQPPALVNYLETQSAPGAVLVRWEPLYDMDLAGYEIGFGPTSNPAAFTYRRDLGASAGRHRLPRQ